MIYPVTHVCLDCNMIVNAPICPVCGKESFKVKKTLFDRFCDHCYRKTTIENCPHCGKPTIDIEEMTTFHKIMEWLSHKLIGCFIPEHRVWKGK